MATLAETGNFFLRPIDTFFRHGKITLTAHAGGSLSVSLFPGVGGSQQRIFWTRVVVSLFFWPNLFRYAGSEVGPGRLAVRVFSPGMIFGNLVGEFYVRVGAAAKAVASVKMSLCSHSVWIQREFLLYGESNFFVFTSRKLLPSSGLQ